MLDTTTITEVVFGLVDRLGQDYSGGDEEFKVGRVAIVVELNTGDATVVTYRCNDARRWVQSGLFDAAKRAVLDQ